MPVPTPLATTCQATIRKSSSPPGESDEERHEVPLQIDVASPGSPFGGLQDIASQIPGLSFEAGRQSETPFLRGQSQPGASFDNVAVFIDGVYQLNRNALDVDPLDIERVEVVQGPQSALFGHDSFAGSISYVAARPTERLDLSGEIQIGSNALKKAKFHVSTPLDAIWTGRFSLGYSKMDGTWRNAARPDQHLGSAQSESIAASIATREGTGPFTLRLSARYGRRRLGHPASFALDYRTYNCGSIDAISGAWSYYCGKAPEHGAVDISPDIPDSSARTAQIALHTSYDFEDVVLEGDAAWYWAHSDSYRAFDETSQGEIFGVCIQGGNRQPPLSRLLPVDRLGAVNIVVRNSSVASEYSAELRLHSQPGGRVGWLIGAAFYKSRNQGINAVGAERGTLAPNERYTSLVLTNPFLVGPLATINSALVENPNRQQVVHGESADTNRTLAIFASGDYEVVPRVRLHGEIRYSSQRIGLDSRTSGYLPSFGTLLPPAHLRSVTPRVSLDYRPRKGLLLYLSHARGSRSGGINSVPGLIKREQYFAPEYNWTSEAGLHYRGAGLLRALRLTGYHIDWTNIQIVGFSETPGVNQLITRNTAGVITNGFNASIDVRPATWLGLHFAYDLNDSSFKPGSEDPGGSAFCGLSTRSTISSFCRIVPSATDPAVLVPDISGNRLARTPRVMWNLGIDVAPAAGLLGWRPALHIGVSHQGNGFERVINGFYYGARTLVDARLVLRKPPWTVELWGRNIGRDRYVRFAVQRGPAFYRNQPRPTDLYLGDGRRFGLTVSYSLQSGD